MDITLRQIRAFLTIVQTRSFTKAAALLHLSQPALTVQIRNLEAALGVRLLDRSNRAVEITRVGLELLPVLQRTLSDLDGALGDIREIGAGRRGTVRIAALPSFAASLLPQVIMSCRRDNPALGFLVRDAIASHVVAMVRSEEVDLGLTGGAVADAELDVLHQTTDQLCLVYPESHPIGRKRRIGVRDLVELPLILTNPGTSLRDVIDAALLGVGHTPTLACEVTYMMSAVAMVRAGLGVTVLPRSAREVRVERGLRSKGIDDPAFVRPIALVKKKGRTLPPASVAFLDACIAAMQKLER
ncbi:LysR family transcriptional regulator [Rhodoplanes sp. TEM]|uniref:LysR family transcriptional regulator n=1 Tax=Rhodoplanes tepidamans TaxID=200616 RepID=A0ABT5JIG0_RHOTP|nr:MULTISPECIES: LysR family transcriptional regulator [Rhodoplanes]MDC7789475.1 LysR family transcriptional regulator [Rhodoplanes tepidamans]MDC7986978.1 LysR family transcriptional regulator [Rhodoplanes sp. TEM]MDQ0359010.1 DNA-binding transcriptional LysR family regulator [Rhodoplanes tepidamans]